MKYHNLNLVLKIFNEEPKSKEYIELVSPAGIKEVLVPATIKTVLVRKKLR